MTMPAPPPYLVDPSQMLSAQPTDVQTWYVAKYGGSASDPSSQASQAFQRDRQARSSLGPIQPQPAGAVTLPGVSIGDAGWSGWPGNKPGGPPAIAPPPATGTPTLPAGYGAGAPQVLTGPPVKGEPVTLLDGQQTAYTSDIPVDMRAFNMVHIDVIVTGTNPAGTITLLGGIAFGATYVQLGSPLAVMQLSANRSWDVLCGAVFLKAQLSAVSGSFSGTQGFRVVATPFFAPGAEYGTGSGSLFDGTQNASASAAALNNGNSQPCSSVFVQSDPSNTTDVYVGNATSQSVRYTPKDGEQFTVNNVNLIYIKAVSGTPRVNWHARP